MTGIGAEKKEYSIGYRDDEEMSLAAEDNAEYE